jgi:quinol monooxygenase YgiN
MRYEFKKDCFEAGCAAWRSAVLEKAEQAPGLVRMQLLTSSPNALAIGTWTDKKYAESFMQTGVFTRLMSTISDMLVSHPVPEQWSLDSYREPGKLS